MTHRPRTVLAMAEGLEAYVLDDARRARLAEVATVVGDAPLHELRSDEARARLADAEVLLTHWGAPRIDPDVLDAAPALRLVAHGAGTVRDHVPRAVLERGVVVTSAAAGNAEPVARYALAAILLAGKGAFVAREVQRRTPDVAHLAARRPSAGVVGLRVGIVGASRVGRRTMALLREHDVELLVADPYLDDDAAAALGARRCELDELLGRSHVVSLHAPALPETRHLLDAARLASLRDGCVVVNTARGSLVDHEALLAEVRTGRISAVLDVTDPEPLPDDHPLRTVPNVFLTPHLAGSEGREVPPMTALAIEEVARLARGEPPAHPVRLEDYDRLA